MRVAAEERYATRHAGPEPDLELDSDTVVDLTSVTKDEERQLAIEHRIRSLELALRDAETRAESAELELDGLRRPAHAEPSPDTAEVAPAATDEPSSSVDPRDAPSESRSKMKRRFRSTAHRERWSIFHKPGRSC